MIHRSFGFESFQTRTPPVGREAAWAGFLDLTCRSQVGPQVPANLWLGFSVWTHSHSRRPVPRVFALVEVQKERCR
jgi:hypothetical protein